MPQLTVWLFFLQQDPSKGEFLQKILLKDLSKHLSIGCLTERPIDEYEIEMFHHDFVTAGYGDTEVELLIDKAIELLNQTTNKLFAPRKFINSAGLPWEIAGITSRQLKMAILPQTRCTSVLSYTLCSFHATRSTCTGPPNHTTAFAKIIKFQL